MVSFYTSCILYYSQVAFSAKTHHDLKLAYSEFYLSLILIQNYQNLNFTGFRKILKKHDKVSGSNLSIPNS